MLTQYARDCSTFLVTLTRALRARRARPPACVSTWLGELFEALLSGGGSLLRRPPIRVGADAGRCCRLTTYRYRFARAAPAPRAKRNDSKNRGRASPVNGRCNMGNSLNYFDFQDLVRSSANRRSFWTPRRKCACCPSLSFIHTDCNPCQSYLKVEIISSRIFLSKSKM